jgi:site-specific DNA-methyltransferase (adenine-specific)
MPELYRGDCLAVMRDLADSTVDAVVTDPPFSSGATREAGQTNFRKVMIRSAKGSEWFGSDCLSTPGFAFLIRSCAMEWRRVLKPGGHVLCFIDWRMSAIASDAIESADLRRAGLVVWDKTYFGMGSCFRNQHELVLHFTKGGGAKPQRRDVGNVIRCKPVRGGDHPTEKPVPLLADLLSVVCPPGGVVLDPFAGSGSTGVACVETGRRFIGIERDPGYFRTAKRRIAAAERAQLKAAA